MQSNTKRPNWPLRIKLDRLLVLVRSLVPVPYNFSWCAYTDIDREIDIDIKQGSVLA